MRSLIRKIISEMAVTNLRKELISMGPKRAQETLGISLEDYVTVAYDNDIIDYVSNHIPELTDLTKYSNNTYDYDGKGPLQGLVFKYVGKHKNRKGDTILPYAIIPQPKLTYLMALERLLTPDMLIEFINEFYELNVTRIVKMPETNFG